MNDIRTMVMQLLNQFRENQRNIELLRYELEHPPMVTEEEMISALSFGHGEYTGTTSGHISDKTLYIALNYKDKIDRSTTEAVHEVASELSKLEKRQQRLLHYIGLMDEKDSEIIRMTFMDAMDTEQIAAKLGVSERTIRTRRATAIEHLCRMFEYTASLHQESVAE